jgi:hypothetical protein
VLQAGTFLGEFETSRDSSAADFSDPHEAFVFKRFQIGSQPSELYRRDSPRVNHPRTPRGTEPRCSLTSLWADLAVGFDWRPAVAKTVLIDGVDFSITPGWCWIVQLQALSLNSQAPISSSSASLRRRRSARGL